MKMSSHLMIQLSNNSFFSFAFNSINWFNWFNSFTSFTSLKMLKMMKMICFQRLNFLCLILFFAKSFLKFSNQFAKMLRRRRKCRHHRKLSLICWISKWCIKKCHLSNFYFSSRQLLRHNMQETSIFLLRKIISSHLVFCRCASRNDKFVTRLSSATRIVWFTKLDDNSTAFTSLSNSSSYIRRDSSQKIWTKCEAIDRDMWRLRLADV
jgi:hypothetical protein